MEKLSIDSQENLGFLLAKASQRWNELLYDQFCQEGYKEISPSYGSILLPLFAEDGLRMGELCKKSRLSKQAMTTIIKTMEKKQLLVRKRDPNDGRSFRIYLTPHSKKFQKKIGGILSRMDELVSLQITSNQRTKLSSTLKLLMNLSNGQSQK